MRVLGRRGPAGAVVLCLIGVLSWVGSSPASAHAGLLQSDPQAATVLDRAPTSVSLTFSDQIQEPAYVVVSENTGRRVDVGPTRVRRNVVRVALDLAAPGTYTVSFRVVSADGHPVAESYSFAYRQVSPGTVLAPVTPAGSVAAGRGADPDAGQGQPLELLIGGAGAAGLAALLGWSRVRKRRR